jgi:hypothetical protein
MEKRNHLVKENPDPRNRNLYVKNPRRLPVRRNLFHEVDLRNLSAKNPRRPLVRSPRRLPVRRNL